MERSRRPWLRKARLRATSRSPARATARSGTAAPMAKLTVNRTAQKEM